MTKVQCPSAAFTASPSDDGNIDVDVQNFANEREMLLAFRECFLGYDPDVLTGYDVVEHLVQIMARADVLLPGTELSGQFAYFSRLPNEKTKATLFFSRRMSANSNREFKVLTMAGRIVLDMRQIIERDERLRTYSFAEAVYSITKKTKEVLDERQLTHLWLWDGSAESRRRVLDYCRRDVQRCMELVRNGASLITYIEMARVTGLNISETFHRGQMIRFFSQLFRYCRQRNILVPSQTDRNDSGMTEGPLNFYPEVGFNTEDACVVLDFRSLYPSIIMAHNLSYDTIINKSDLALLPSAEGEHLYEAGLGPMESYFVKSSVRKGIVPIVLQDMLDERGKKLEELKLLHTILNGRQLAYKVAANAIYGFTGSRDSKLQCLPIAESTILHGAHMLAKLKQEIEDTFRVDNGFPIDCYVLYGDTDSVFVCMPRTSVADAFKYGKEIAVRMTEKFPRPIQLEFEKVYFPFVLLNRKRYAGLQWTMIVMVPKAEKIDAKGIESQRRDSCPLLTKMITNALIQLADERKTCVERASEYIKAVVGKMLAGDYDMGEFIMTKGLWLGTNTEDYKGKQVHTELVKRMRARDPNLNFADGERILSTSITNHAYEKSEDPLFALEKDLELDYRYYLDHQLVNQLTRIFDVMLSPQPKRTASLFRGDHVRFARNRVSAVPKGISAYFDKSQEYSVCMECRVRVPADRALCDSCLPKLRTVYQRTLDTNNTNEIERTQLASNCRQCQGSQFREILCVNSDCDVFYKRKHRELNSKRNVDAVQRIESAKDWTLDW
ncbi:DNA polymerase family B-domain-containing protein [Cladochytrium replicatum]|nr:DNA polymerase family B-domain-containing protein [Cladochytrium replicatum]